MTPRIWNTIENLTIALITILVINFIIIQPLRKEMREQFKIVAAIASQPKYSISNDFEKMRTKKGGSIILDLNNKMDIDNQELVIPKTSIVDSTFVSAKKQSFWRKLLRTIKN